MPEPRVPRPNGSGCGFHLKTKGLCKALGGDCNDDYTSCWYDWRREADCATGILARALYARQQREREEASRD